MIYIGIDVAKDKHDCFIADSEGKAIFEPFIIKNNIVGFKELYEKIQISKDDTNEVKVGLESTGHYSINLLNFLVRKKLPTFVINPLHTNLYRKSLSLRQTKTDTIDTRAIVSMLISNLNLIEYKKESKQTDELKSLSRYRYDKIRERAKLKVSVSRLVNILFPELETMVSSIHNKSIYTLLKAYPSAEHISNADLDELEDILKKTSRGHFKKEKAEAIYNAAKMSIGTNVQAKCLELNHTIRLIFEYNKEVKEIQEEIKRIMEEVNSPILTIPGISYTMGAMIIGEIGDFTKFSTPDKILAYAGSSPTTYQSGKIKAGIYAHMEKRGSKYLRYALFNSTRFVCKWDETFASYLNKKISEGKHYKVAVSHASKKLVRIMFYLEKTGESYKKN